MQKTDVSDYLRVNAAQGHRTVKTKEVKVQTVWRGTHQGCQTNFSLDYSNEVSVQTQIPVKSALTQTGKEIFLKLLDSFDPKFNIEMMTVGV